MLGPTLKPLELWGGIECTVNRLGDGYRDQLHLTGHHRRQRDLDLLATLGLAALRYPVLWERVAPNAPQELHWQWSDRRLARLRKLRIRPIVGLVHHGSGPRYTSLLDSGFAPGLAAFAGAVARRYPWIEDWTPVNEPLTTARFSAMYGHWYPHTRDEKQFWIALLNQVDAVRLAMRAIREVTQRARLIQTEDLGRTYATDEVADQASHDNTRRWMTWDLLCGKVLPGHDMWDHLCRLGLRERLEVIADDPCPPDVVGINHYLTSDRFLDHRIERYPRHSHGGNGRQQYADVEAIRALDPPPHGLAGAIRDAWGRYRLPVAVTEAHNGCSREEQMRWFRDAWLDGERARAEGVDLRAVTSWALFGSQGWDTLLTGEGRYEPGAFDVSSGRPRPTALAGLLPSLASGEVPADLSPGWWRRDLRLHYPAVRVADANSANDELQAPQGAPLLITGASGTLGRAMAAACERRGLAFVLTGRSELDLLDKQSIAAALDRHQPWALINCSGWVRVDDAEDAADACLAVNSDGAAALSRACDQRGVRTLSFSSDLVFSGRKRSAYLERDAVAPRNVYGHSKAKMERYIGGLGGRHLVVRTAAFFSPFDEANFAVHLARSLIRGERFAAAEDYVVTPTYVPDLCEASLDLLIDGETGIWHLSNEEAVSWSDFGARIACGLGHDPALVAGVPGHRIGWRAKRPRASAIASERGALMPSLQTAIDRFCAGFTAREAA